MTCDMVSVHDYNNKLFNILKVIFMVIDRYGNFEFAVKLLYGKKKMQPFVTNNLQPVEFF